MTEKKHTPLPWGYDGDGFDSVAAQHCGTDGYTVFPVDEDGDCDGASICEIEDCGNDDEAEANAAFIVLACNSHYELLEALKRAWRDHTAGNFNAETHNIIEAAIAKAEGR